MELSDLGKKSEKHSDELLAMADKVRQEVQEALAKVPRHAVEAPSWPEQPAASDDISSRLSGAGESNQMFEACQAKTQPDRQAQMLIITRDAIGQNASELQASQETSTPSPVDNSGCNGNPIPACAAGKFTFTKYGLGAATQVCCSEDSTACTGCKTTGAGG